MANLKISALPAAPSIDQAGEFALAQDVGAGLTTYRATVAQIGAAIATGTVATFVPQATSGGPVAYMLPTAATHQDEMYLLKDTDGQAGTNNVTVSVTGGGNIDGSASVIISANYGVLRVWSDGTQWWSL